MPLAFLVHESTNLDSSDASLHPPASARVPAIIAEPDIISPVLCVSPYSVLPVSDRQHIRHSHCIMHIFPQRACLQELGGEIFKLVSCSATLEQWAEWLRVPLEHAVARGNLDLVKTLLEAGADGSAGWRGCRGRTLLDAAAVGGNPVVVTALLEAGAQPDVNVVSISSKRSSLYAATVSGHEEVARRLILAGADVKFEDPLDQCTVLHKACCCGHEQLVNDLLIRGAAPNSVFGPGGSTPLHQAAGAGQCGAVSALLLRGADKNAPDRHEATPLMWAAWFGQVAAVETMLAAGADFSIRDNNSKTALDHAACRGQIPVIKVVLGQASDVNARDRKGYSALRHAARKNHAGAIDALVEGGADVELQSNNGETALFDAAYFSNAESMLSLWRHGAGVMMRSKHEKMPLHRACYGKCPGLAVAVDLLLRWGADETALDRRGRTPADSLDQLPSNNLRRCSQEEVERARLLLARAPADRAWRRRSWLLMLRSRASSKARSEGHADGGTCGDPPDINAVSGVGEAKCHPGGSRGVERDGGGRCCGAGGGGGGAGVAADGGYLSRLMLIGLEMDGVFRTVVGFL